MHSNNFEIRVQRFRKIDSEILSARMITNPTQRPHDQIAYNSPHPAIVIKAQIGRSLSVKVEGKFPFPDWLPQRTLKDIMSNRTVSHPTEACKIASKEAGLVIAKGTISC